MQVSRSGADIRTPTALGFQALPFAMLLLLALIWGSSFILMKRGLEYFDSFEVAAYRMSIAMIVLLPIALRNLKLLRGRFWPLFLTGLLEPALILTMGVVVLLIVLAVLMPIIEINQLVH